MEIMVAGPRFLASAIGGSRVGVGVPEEDVASCCGEFWVSPDRLRGEGQGERWGGQGRLLSVS